MKKALKKVFSKLFFYVALFIVLAVVLIPYLWMVSGSFKTTLEIQSADVTKPELSPSWIPRKFTWENYLRVNRTVRMLDYFRNSLIISIGTMIFSVIISLFAAYGLSRFNFSWKHGYTLLTLSTQMFPGISFLIPYFMMFVLIRYYLGIPMQNTYWGMIFTYTSFALPFSVLMLRNFLDSIPREIDEQAQIDGCTPFGALMRVILPLSKPGIAAVGIYSFIMAWNEVLFATVLTGRETKTVALGLLEYITAQQARWSGMMAACILVSIPVLILFSFMQKYIIEGLVAGATKG
ncbi:carbohydrate ABC transporter permease [Thermatribacter velox]|uniref:Carbohydrate ABC transporter permease n=1 Tax=Thermatribacter velox TaxID=3039681 RepID=A0ABZ2YBW9_9BACT